MIWPCPCASILGSTAAIPCRTPLMLTSIIQFHSEPVWKVHVLAASRLVINWIMAIRIHVSVVSGKASKSLLNRRERLSQPKVRSTIQRHCSTRNPCVLRGRFTIERVRCKTVATPINQRPGVSPVCPDELQPRKAGDQPRENMFGSITILDPGRMNHYSEKQAQNVHDDVAFATQGALAPVITADPPFSVVFTV
jgi:hypothetical protein